MFGAVNRRSCSFVEQLVDPWILSPSTARERYRVFCSLHNNNNVGRADIIPSFACANVPSEDISGWNDEAIS